MVAKDADGRQRHYRTLDEELVPVKYSTVQVCSTIAFLNTYAIHTHTTYIHNIYTQHTTHASHVHFHTRTLTPTIDALCFSSSKFNLSLLTPSVFLFRLEQAWL